jgi:DNA-binding XRE family transcriptional regulator
MYLLLKCVGAKSTLNLESGGEEVTLLELSKSILVQFNCSTENIFFKTDEILLSNNYSSDKEDFENLAKKFDYSLTNLAEQVENVANTLKRKILH